MVLQIAFPTFTEKKLTLCLEVFGKAVKTALNSPRGTLWQKKSSKFPNSGEKLWPKLFQKVVKNYSDCLGENSEEEQQF